MLLGVLGQGLEQLVVCLNPLDVGLSVRPDVVSLET